MITWLAIRNERHGLRQPRSMLRYTNRLRRRWEITLAIREFFEEINAK